MRFELADQGGLVIAGVTTSEKAFQPLIMQGYAAAADELQARTEGVAAAVNDYVASSEERVSARNDLVEGFNSGVDERNTSGSLDIARNQLPLVIDRYRESVADLEEKETALMIAVARLEEAP